MTNERASANGNPTSTERLDKIYQLCLVGRAALNTNLTEPHIASAVAELLEVIEDLAAHEQE